MLVGVTEWNGIVSPTLDAAASLAVFDVISNDFERRGTVALSQPFPPFRTQEIAASGIKTLICGAVSSPLAALITSQGIEIVPFVAGPVEEVLRAFMAGTLPAPQFAMPGCCGRRWRWGAGNRRGRGFGKAGRSRP
ncbi:MAG TPA: dinitrogenase iron-molybdenum cofactor biosynthesis protein [Planctomycetes bacterium]|nr:dinitrogenase iron-molybdenum cofactor biosynthesis protein [Planctomycetota bacterium]